MRYRDVIYFIPIIVYKNYIMIFLFMVSIRV